MISNNSLSRQLPDFISQDPYIAEILKTKALEYTSLDEFKEDIKKQLFVDTATWGLVLWEKALGLPVVRTNSNVIPLEEDNPQLQLFGNWTTIAAGGTNGKIVRCDASDGDNWVKIDFWGTGIRLIRSATTPDECLCNIHLDTIKYTAENKSANNPSNNEVFFEVKELPWGIHSLRMSFAPLSTGSLNNRYCSLDRAEVINSLAEGYDKRRAMVKAKLLPIRNVTNQTVRDLAAAYGFHNLILDESVPYVYRVEFDRTESSSYELRKQIFSDLEKIIPAHISLKKKVMVSTFHDIDVVGLCWDELYDNYYYNDFFDLGTIGPLGKYNYLNEYFDLSIFSFQSFNYDINTIDQMIYNFHDNNLHSNPKIRHQNIIYNTVYNSVTMTNTQIANYFSELNRKLLSDAERLQLYRICTNAAIPTGHVLTLSETTSKYVEMREKIRTALKQHPYLATKGYSITTNDLAGLLTYATYLAGDVTWPTVPTMPSTKILEGKVAYDGTTLITGIVKTMDVAADVAALPTTPGGFDQTNVYVPANYTMSAQADLKPENIEKGYTFFNVVGTFQPVNTKQFNKGDMIFPWQTTDNTSDGHLTEFKIRY